VIIVVGQTGCGKSTRQSRFLAYPLKGVDLEAVRADKRLLDLQKYLNTSMKPAGHRRITSWCVRSRDEWQRRAWRQE
jgi:hypothetical protein